MKKSTSEQVVKKGYTVTFFEFNACSKAFYCVPVNGLRDLKKRCAIDKNRIALGCRSIFDGDIRIIKLWFLPQKLTKEDFLLLTTKERWSSTFIMREN